MPSIKTWGPWPTTIPGGMQPGATGDYFWEIGPLPTQFFTYQVTVHAFEIEVDHNLAVVQTSVEWNPSAPLGQGSDASSLKLHATIKNVGTNQVNGFNVVISIIEPN